MIWDFQFIVNSIRKFFRLVESLVSVFFSSCASVAAELTVHLPPSRDCGHEAEDVHRVIGPHKVIMTHSREKNTSCGNNKTFYLYSTFLILKDTLQGEREKATMKM